MKIKKLIVCIFLLLFSFLMMSNKIYADSYLLNGTWSIGSISNFLNKNNIPVDSVKKIVFVDTSQKPRVTGMSYSGEVSIPLNSTMDITWGIKGTTLYFQYNGTLQFDINSQSLFSNLTALEEIEGLEYVRTQQVNNFNSMFRGDTSLKYLDLSSFNSAKVTSMAYMFEGCSSLTSVNLSSFNTAKVVTFSHMFDGCSSIETLDISNFNSSSATYSADMFTGCNKLKRLKVSQMNLTIDLPVTLYDSNFNAYNSFTNLLPGTILAKKYTITSNYIDDFDILYGNEYGELPNPNRYGYSFNGWYNSKNELITSSTIFTGDTTFNARWIPNEYTITYYGLDESKILTHDDDVYGELLSPSKEGYKFKGWYKEQNFETLVTENTIFEKSNVTLYPKWQNAVATLKASFSDMLNSNNGYLYTKIDFDSITKIKKANTLTDNIEKYLISSEESGYNIYAWQDKEILYYYTNAPKIYLENSTYSFSDLVYIEEIDLSIFDTSRLTTMNYMFSNDASVTSLDLSGFDTRNVTSMREMFYNNYLLTELDISNFDTNWVTDMSYMFADCRKLQSLDLEHFYTISLKTASHMFYNCYELTYLNISSFNTLGVNDMSYMFSGCKKLTTLNLSNFNTENVTDMSYMFNGCSNLTSLNISSFNTSKVTKMSRMFKGCSSLTSLNLSNFNTEKVTKMDEMFSECSGLTSLNVSSFNTSKVTTMEHMFSYCSNLETINVSNFNTSNVTNMSYMFYNCTKLKTLDTSNFTQNPLYNLNALRMFQNGCPMELDLSGLDGSRIMWMDTMFYGCGGRLKQLKTFEVSDDNYLDIYSLYDLDETITYESDHIVYNIPQGIVLKYRYIREFDGGIQKKFFYGEKYGDLPSPTKVGSTFAGWYNSNDELITSDSIFYGDTAFIAKWTPIKYTITWKNYDGTILETDDNLEYGNTPTYGGETPTREKTVKYTYTFAGWTPGVDVVTQSVYYTATYTKTANNYTVIFDGNDAVDGQMNSINCVFDEECYLPRNVFSKTNYVFLGWSGTLDGEIITRGVDLGRVVSGEGLKIRSAPTSNSEIVSSVPNDAIVEIIDYVGYGDGCNDRWVNLKVSNNLYGYACSTFIENLHNNYIINYEESETKTLYAKWEELGIAIESDTESINFGETLINFNDYIKRNIKIKNVGENSVSLTINNPTGSGPFASLSFENNKVLAPGEEYEVKLIANYNSPFADIPGTYNGNYVITATLVGGTKTTSVEIPATIKINKYPMALSYTTHVQSYGWQEYVKDGEMAGTSGEAKRLEAIKIRIDNPDYSGNVLYRTHIQTYGWEKDFKKNDEMSGTSGEAKRLEAIEIKLDGAMAEHYDIYYRVHAQRYGWLGWAKNGEPAGTAGYAFRLEGIEIRLVEKGKPFEEYGKKEPFKEKKILYTTHVQSYGWQDYVADGAMAGTSGEAKRLEAIRIKLNNPKYEGDIEYRTHIQTYGWEKDFKKNDEMSGTSGEAKRLEAIEIRLTGAMAEHYDIYYRVHAQRYGWLAWAKNGERSGTAGFGFRLEGIEIVLVEKGEQPPVRDNQNNNNSFIQNEN